MTADRSRNKLYSAARTGMKHLNPVAMRESFLMRPSEQTSIPPIIAVPGMIDTAGNGKASSALVIFAVWSTMAGSAIVYLPGNF